eukprot:scaffold757_cov246-Pinguiococcus_pyrenoidosus.AAC.24
MAFRGALRRSVRHLMRPVSATTSVRSSLGVESVGAVSLFGLRTGSLDCAAGGAGREPRFQQ